MAPEGGGRGPAPHTPASTPSFRAPISEPGSVERMDTVGFLLQQRRHRRVSGPLDTSLKGSRGPRAQQFPTQSPLLLPGLQSCPKASRGPPCPSPLPLPPAPPRLHQDQAKKCLNRPAVRLCPAPAPCPAFEAPPCPRSTPSPSPNHPHKYCFSKDHRQQLQGEETEGGRGSWLPPPPPVSATPATPAQLQPLDFRLVCHRM